MTFLYNVREHVPSIVDTGYLSKLRLPEKVYFIQCLGTLDIKELAVDN